MYVIDPSARIELKWGGVLNRNDGFFRCPHSNPYFNWIAVTEGPVHLKVGHEQLVLGSGELLLLEPWEEHCGWKELANGQSFYWMQIAIDPGPVRLQQPNAVKPDFNLENESILLPRRYLPRRKFEALQLFERISHEQEAPDIFFRLRCNAHLHQLVLCVAEDWYSSHDVNKAPTASFLTLRLMQTQIHAFFHHDFETVKDHLLRVTNKNYTYLSHLFTKWMGVPIIQYVHKQRMKKAKHFLIHTSMSMEQIAKATGYSDAFYFSKQFKKMEGVSPRNYRNKFDSL